MKHFEEFVCVRSGQGFKKGDVYAACGNNNGFHIVRETSNGDLCEAIIHNSEVIDGKNYCFIVSIERPEFVCGWNQDKRALFYPNTRDYYKGQLDIDENEKCWSTGIYTEECCCEMCEHNSDCTKNGDDKY